MWRSYCGEVTMWRSYWQPSTVHSLRYILVLIGSDRHDKPFCTKAITIINNFKKVWAIPIIDKSDIFKVILVITQSQISANKILEASISPEIPVTEIQKSWFAESETSSNDSSTVRVALQKPKTVTQLRFFKLR